MSQNLKSFVIAYALCSACAYAGAAKITNETDAPIKVFVRVHGQGNSYKTTEIPAHDSTILMIENTLLGLKNDQFYYDIIASSALKSTVDPDWQLLAGECDNLFSGDDTGVVIQTAVAGLKTTCKVVDKK